MKPLAAALILLLATVTAQAATYTDREVELLAKTVYGEARGCTPDEQRLVVWTALQRLAANGYGDTIEAVITAPGQFIGYRDKNPVCPVISELVREELGKWAAGEPPPTLEPFAPTARYLYFAARRGDCGKMRNFFREVWR